MKRARVHGIVYLWWGRGWAVQFVRRWQEIALGVRFTPERLCLDIYLGPLTLAFGREPIRTDITFAQRSVCRGFIVSGTPEEAIL